MKKAFTLIELLVVIGILAILMGILISTIGGSSESARAAKCLTNLRNLAMAVQARGMSSGSYPFAGPFKQYYIHDVNGKRQRDIKDTQGWVGNDVLKTYDGDEETRRECLKNGTIWAAINKDRAPYTCPSHVSYASGKGFGTPLWSYAMSSFFGWKGESGAPRAASYSGRGYRTFRRSDRYLLFAELPYAQMKVGSKEIQSGNLTGDQLDSVLDYEGGEVIGFNHKDGRNVFGHVCFADGHVEKLRAPGKGSISDLTEWLCMPTENAGDFDISFDGNEYRKVR